MDAVITVVIPIFGIIAAGYVAGRLKWLGPASSEALNGFVYYVALPALFYVGMSRSPIERVLDVDLVAAFVGAVLYVFVFAAIVAVVAFRHRLGAASLHGLAASFPNSGYMGVPLFVLAFGAEGALPVIVANVAQTITVFIVVLFLLELSTPPAGGRRRHLGHVLGGLVANPLLIGAGLGLAVNALGLATPKPLLTMIEILSQAASPCALFSLGLFMVGRSIREGLGEVLWISVAKLVIQPLVQWLVCTRLFDLPDETVRKLVLIAALPTGALVFVVAQRYGTFVQRGSSAVLITTLLSLVTISLLMVFYVR